MRDYSRFLLCLGLSLVLHVFIIAVPWAFLPAAQKHMDVPPPIPVGLVENIPEDQAPDQTPDQTKDQPEETGDALEFKAMGRVSADYMDRLKVKIFHVWEYPQKAILKGHEGQVSISFVLNEGGRVEDLRVINGSGDRDLDHAALCAVKKAAPFGAFTSDMEEQKTLEITGHFLYVLD